MNDMSAKDVDRLIDWLLANGHTLDEARECIKYIVGTQAPAQG